MIGKVKRAFRAVRSRFRNHPEVEDREDPVLLEDTELSEIIDLLYVILAVYAGISKSFDEAITNVSRSLESFQVGERPLLFGLSSFWVPMTDNLNAGSHPGEQGVY